MDNKKILLVNLSKGRTGQLNMQLLGMIFVMKFQAAAMNRANVPESERKDFALYVDEFQNFSTDSFATILSEARKYHLNLIAANQFTHQLTEEIRDAVFGNVGTTIAFRVGDRDSEALQKYFRPSFDETDLLRMPNYNAAVRTMIGGIPTLPFSMATLPPLGSPNPKLAEALKQLSAAKYGRPRKTVEDEIFARMATKADEPLAPLGPGSGSGASWPSPSWQTAPSAASQDPLTPPRAASSAPKTGSSFLDEWLAKRESKRGKADAPKAPSALRQPPRTVGESVTGPAADTAEHEAHGSSTMPMPQPHDSRQGPALAPSGAAGDVLNDRPEQHAASAQPDGTDDQTDTIYIDQEGTLHLRDDR